MFPSLPEETLEKLRKMIIKRKNHLKRNYAKTRKSSSGLKKEFYVISDLVHHCAAQEDVIAEIKKKRNRMSAQISRDRKKMKIQEL